AGHRRYVEQRACIAGARPGGTQVTAQNMADDATDRELVRKLQRELEEAQETLRAIRQGEVDALGVDGPHGPQLFTLQTAEQPYRVRVEQMHVGAGVESLCLVVTDLVELTRTRVARAAAEAASQAKDQFLAMRGHELRNPLGAISSAVSVLGQSATPEHDRRAREVIAHQTAHLTRLVGDLLDVTRGALGKIELVRTTIDVAAIVRRCLVTLESSEKLAHHAGAIEAQPVWVEADQARIEQIIMNLMSNSLKFTPNGGAIKVIVRREQDEAVLQIIDDGSGISADLLPSVFDLFVQGDRSIDRRS